MKDPVCGMEVDPAQAAGSMEYGGTTYYFCGTGCLDRFRADPERFTQPAGGPPEPFGAKAILYTCPMHPEVRQLGPGTCPKCGMALEPAQPSPAPKATRWTCPMHPQFVQRFRTLSCKLSP